MGTHPAFERRGFSVKRAGWDRRKSLLPPRARHEVIPDTASDIRRRPLSENFIFWQAGEGEGSDQGSKLHRICDAGKFPPYDLLSEKSFA